VESEQRVASDVNAIRLFGCLKKNSTQPKRKITMATDIPKLVTDMFKGFPSKPPSRPASPTSSPIDLSKGFPAREPNGTYAPPQSQPKPLPDIGTVYDIVGINNKSSKSPY
jgi:hypothetical protein